MCFHCPAELNIDDGAVTIRVHRLPDLGIDPSDVTQDAQTLAELRAGDRSLMALEATIYVESQPVAVDSLHGIVESDAEGGLACAFDHEWAMSYVVQRVCEMASATGYL